MRFIKSIFLLLVSLLLVSCCKDPYKQYDYRHNLYNYPKYLNYECVSTFTTWQKLIDSMEASDNYGQIIVNMEKSRRDLMLREHYSFNTEMTDYQKSISCYEIRKTVLRRATKHENGILYREIKALEESNRAKGLPIYARYLGEKELKKIIEDAKNKPEFPEVEIP